MAYSRMFTASCDKCYKEYDEGFWWKLGLIDALVKAGWKATPASVLCPECR